MIPFHHRNHFLNLGKNILSLSEFDSVFYVLELDSDINRIEFQNQKTIPKFAEFISKSLNWIKDGD